MLTIIEYPETEGATISTCTSAVSCDSFTIEETECTVKNFQKISLWQPVPDSFYEALEDLKNDDVVDIDVALNEKPAHG